MMVVKTLSLLLLVLTTGCAGSIGGTSAPMSRGCENLHTVFEQYGRQWFCLVNLVDPPMEEPTSETLHSALCSEITKQ